MAWPQIAFAVARRWWVFLPVLAVLAAFSFSIREIGAEYVADAQVLATAPGVENAVTEPPSTTRAGPIILATVELRDESYREQLAAEGLSDTFDIDYATDYPMIHIRVRGRTYDAALGAAERIANDLAARIVAVQAERGAVGVVQIGARVGGVIPPSTHQPGGMKALAGLLGASLMIAGGLAYGVDQFILPVGGRRPVERPALIVSGRRRSTT